MQPLLFNVNIIYLAAQCLTAWYAGPCILHFFRKLPICNFRNRKNVSWQMQSFFFFKLKVGELEWKSFWYCVYKQLWWGCVRSVMKVWFYFCRKNLKINLYSFIFYFIKVYRILICIYCVWLKIIMSVLPFKMSIH